MPCSFEQRTGGAKVRFYRPSKRIRLLYYLHLDGESIEEPQWKIYARSSDSRRSSRKLKKIVHEMWTFYTMNRPRVTFVVMCAMHALGSARHYAVPHARMLCVDFRYLRRFRHDTRLRCILRVRAERRNESDGLWVL